MAPMTAEESSQPPGKFSIVDAYNRLLADDPELTMPVAAIEALVDLLASSGASTISETLDLLQRNTAELKAAIPNSISLSAGTDLFQRYLVTSLQRPGSLGPAGADFDAIRSHLITNARLFVNRAKAARYHIADIAMELVRDGNTILTNGGSRVVGSLLNRMAEKGRRKVRFSVVYVLADGAEGREVEGMKFVHALREKGVPVAVIPEAAVAYSMGKVDLVMVGAEGVVANGGIISRLGTYQLAILAGAIKKPFYVAAESHKCVRLFPLGQYDLPVEQDIVRFKSSNDDEAVKDTSEGELKGSEGVERIGRRAIDFTPPELITALITESGVLTPSAISEELIKIWF